MAGIVQKGTPKRSTKKPLPGFREEEACGARSYLSRPHRVGISTSIFWGKTGCCGFTGPCPSATLDKILTKLSEVIVELRAGKGKRKKEFFREIARRASKGCFRGPCLRGGLRLAVNHPALHHQPDLA